CVWMCVLLVEGRPPVPTVFAYTTLVRSDPAAVGMPEITGTEAWNRRILNTQLASWAELRDDTLLYAKQSYTGVPGCEYPDAYVEDRKSTRLNSSHVKISYAVFCTQKNR